MKIRYNVEFGGGNYEKLSSIGTDESKTIAGFGGLKADGEVEFTLEEMIEMFKNHREDITNLQDFLKMELPTLINGVGTAIADAHTAITLSEYENELRKIELCKKSEESRKKYYEE